MASTGSIIRTYHYSVDDPPVIVGELAAGATVTITVWQNGVELPLMSSGCIEIDTTGKFSWSTANLPTITTSRAQYSYRMESLASDTDDGDFILITNEGKDGVMPSLGDKGSYIVQN